MCYQVPPLPASPRRRVKPLPTPPLRLCVSALNFSAVDKARDKARDKAESPMNLSVIILTYNEERHIQRCIELARPLGASVFVVDCFSTDQTVELARVAGAQVVQHAWPGNQADQLNWALDNLPIHTEWALRLDADEYLRPALIEEIRAKLDTLPADINGVAFHLERFFMGRLIRRGIPDVTIVRLFRFGKARCERRLMDERMVLLEGRDITFAGSFVDDNLNDLAWWTQKHLGYAIREAADMLDIEYGLFDRSNAEGLCDQAAAKRRMKLKYARAPLFWRALVYFCMRYFVRGGFLEGREGFMWHFFQGLWYRMLVDARIWEIKRDSGGDREKILELLRTRYGLKV